MVKTHTATNFKYLCYTKSEGEVYNSYKGSGKVWKSHLTKHGNDIVTELIFESTDKNEFRKIAIQKSLEFDIVNSLSWANLKIESGDGGDTVSNKQWITDGKTDKYIIKDSKIPDGWKLGRTNCVFNNKENQKEFSLMVDVKVRGESIRKAWKSGKMNNRDHSSCGVKGDLNPSKRKEVREKISNSRKIPVTVYNIKFQSIGEAAYYFNVCYGTIKRWINRGFGHYEI